MYEIYLNELCINQDVFYSENYLNLLGYDRFQYWCQTGKLNRVRTKGRFRSGLITFQSIPEDLRQQITKAYGNPYIKDDKQDFINQIKPDASALEFYNEYRYEDGRGVSDEKKAQYICEAQILNLYKSVIDNYEVKIKASGRKGNRGALKKKLSTIINDLKKECYPNSTTQKYPHKLPTNYRSIDRKLYGAKDKIGYILKNEINYEGLIHQGIGNDRAKKIKGDIAKWLIAQYSMPNKVVTPVLHTMYNRVRKEKGWCKLSESAIYKWLYEPEQERQWIISRDGIESFRKKFGHKLVRDKQEWFPNSYWAIDGSKIDWMHYYDNDLGVAAKLKMDIVIDAYSEKIIGWSYSESETHIDHFRAVKMAFQESQSRPFLFTYDNQSGHKSSRMQGLYNKMVAKQGGAHYTHAAYRHGSPVEQLFNRFQQQILNMWWFSDGQSIKVRTNNNIPNMDFVMENKHKLLTKEKLLAAWELSVMEWNQAKHPHHNETRNQVYTHEPLMHEAVSYLDMIDMFWVYSADQVTYRADGIKPKVANQQYHFEVYTETGDIDLQFRDRYVGTKFFVKYDPDQLDNYVSLYAKLPNGDKQFVADAQPVRKQQQIPALMKAGDKAQQLKDYEVRKTEEKAAKAKITRIQQETGITPEQLIEDQNLKLKLGGKLPKKLRNQVESEAFHDRM